MSRRITRLYIVKHSQEIIGIAEHAGPYPGCIHSPVRQSDKLHLTGKPTPLMHELVAIVPEGGIILDPFAGSGTTAVAAKETGRHYIAIEKSAYYAAVASQRLKKFS